MDLNPVIWDMTMSTLISCALSLRFPVLDRGSVIDQWGIQEQSKFQTITSQEILLQ